MNYTEISDIFAAILAYYFAIYSGSYVLKKILSPLKIEHLAQGIPNAGRYIGYLERALILTFLLFDQISLIGFVLTIKAIYRYGDIQGNVTEKMKISEYYIIGTLSSVLWTFISYAVYLHIIRPLFYQFIY